MQEKILKIIETTLALIIGSAITILSQMVLECRHDSKERKAEIKELASASISSVFLISQRLNDLAMYKTHKQYYYRLYETANPKDDKTDLLKKHYEKGQEQRQVEKEIDELISSFLQQYTKSKLLLKLPVDFEKYKSDIFEHKFDTASKYQDCKTYEQLINKRENDEKRLKIIYGKFLDKIINYQKEIEAETQQNM